MNPLEQIETVSERADRLGVSPRYIQQLCKSGKLTARYAKSGSSGVWLILKSSGKEEK
jgi:hypothetical protein